MSHRSYTAHYLEPFVADSGELEIVAPSVWMTGSPFLEITAPDVAVINPLEAASSVAILSISGHAEAIAREPVPRLRMTSILSQTAPSDEFPNFYLPLQDPTIEDDVTVGSRPGDVLVAIIASNATVAAPGGFTLRDSRLYDDGIGYMFLGVFTRRLQSGQMPYTWPAAYSSGVVGGTWLAVQLYNVSGAIDVDGMQFEFVDGSGEAQLDAPAITAQGEIGLAAVATRQLPAYILPNAEYWSTELDEWDESTSNYFGVVRRTLYLGEMGGTADDRWTFGPSTVRHVVMSMVIPASPSLEDEGAGAPTGVRFPLR